MCVCVCVYVCMYIYKLENSLDGVRNEPRSDMLFVLQSAWLLLSCVQSVDLVPAGFCTRPLSESKSNQSKTVTLA